MPSFLGEIQTIDKKLSENLNIVNFPLDVSQIILKNTSFM
jgi:hypothetical protein